MQGAARIADAAIGRPHAIATKPSIVAMSILPGRTGIYIEPDSIATQQRTFCYAKKYRPVNIRGNSGGCMLRPTVGRMTVVALLLSILVGAGLWLAIGYGALRVSKKVAAKIEQVPHGPRPQPAKIR
jgi:hypothetical protein